MPETRGAAACGVYRLESRGVFSELTNADRGTVVAVHSHNVAEICRNPSSFSFFIQQYKFKPGMKNGKPVRVELTISLNFNESAN